VSRGGVQEPQVEEPLSGLRPQLFRSEALLQVEFDMAAEPKALSPADLQTQCLVQTLSLKEGPFSVTNISTQWLRIRMFFQPKRYT